MATQINPENVVDWDEPLNQDPIFSGTHVFSTGNITVKRDGTTVATATFGALDLTAPKEYEGFDGIAFYPIDSEFGFELDELGAIEDKTIDGLHEEGWAADLTTDGEQIGLAIADAPTFVLDVTPSVELRTSQRLRHTYRRWQHEGLIRAVFRNGIHGAGPE